jgi:hypothetical protein
MNKSILLKQYPFHILDNKEEKEVLYKIFQMKDADLELLENKISKLLLPVGGILQSGLDYMGFISKIAEKRDISLPVSGSMLEKEKFLFQEISKQNLENMTVAQRKELQQKLLIEAEKKGLSNSEIASISSLAGIGAAQLSGFGIYLLASSTVGAISSLVGVTLPFAFYTGMSSAIGIAIGPIGLLLAAIPLYKTFKDVRSVADFKEKGLEMYKGFKILATGNVELSEMVFTYFAGMRILKMEDYDQQILKAFEKIKNNNQIMEEKQRLLDLEKEKVNRIDREIRVLQRQLEEVQIERNKLQDITQSMMYALEDTKRQTAKINDEVNRLKIAKNNLLK